MVGMVVGQRWRFATRCRWRNSTGRRRSAPCVPRTHRTVTRPLACAAPPVAAQFRTYKIIYRRYAGLFFAFCVDVNDNELSYLESIHLFVEMLDRYFGNVCELDLVFNFHKVGWRRRLLELDSEARVCAALPPSCRAAELSMPAHPLLPTMQVYAILDEYIVSGELQESSQLVMLDRLKELEKLMM